MLTYRFCQKAYTAILRSRDACDGGTGSKHTVLTPFPLIIFRIQTLHVRSKATWSDWTAGEGTGTG